MDCQSRRSSARRPAGRSEAVARGRAIAATLAGAWRPAVPGTEAVEPPADARATADILPLLLQCGSAALAWRRLEHTTLRSVPGVADLQRAYRVHALQAAIHDQSIIRLVRFLRVAGVEPILGKGWAIARLYPDAGLRPYGDVDFFADPGAYDAVFAALRLPGAPAAPVDLHCGAEDLNDRPFAALEARASFQPLGDVAVRLLGAEDHLRLLCLHMLRHGAWRPLWLIDVAVALESRPAGFDWTYFLSGDPRRSEWALSALAVAQQLLGARGQDTPVETAAGRLPRWLIPAMLEQWGRGKPLPQEGRRLQSYFRDRSGLSEALLTRWPNAIQATVSMHGAFNDWPRWPFQVGDCVRRTGRLIAQLSRPA